MGTVGFLGVDWGTHSSKWAFFSGMKQAYSERLPLYSSDIRIDEDSLTFAGEVGSENDGVRGLKAVLINDPLGSSFWTTERLDTKTSLGEAVSFSLACLLANAVENCGIPLQEMQLGFSFPNWLVDQGRKAESAAKNFREAAAVAVEIVARKAIQELPKPPQRGADVAFST